MENSHGEGCKVTRDYTEKDEAFRRRLPRVIGKVEAPHGRSFREGWEVTQSRLQKQSAAGFRPLPAARPERSYERA
jgi:hypothetical protein